MIDIIKITVLIILFVSIVLPFLINFGGLIFSAFTWIPLFARSFILVAFTLLIIKAIRDWIN